jgi:hypothetical protein
MRLKQYIVEDSKVDTARLKLSKQLKVKPEYLEYIDKDSYGYYFNVTDRKHKDYKSTKLVKELFKRLPDIKMGEFDFGKTGGRVKIGDDTEVNITYTDLKDNTWRVDFSLWERGSASTIDVFMGVLRHIQEWVKKHNPKALYLIPAEKRRERIYKALIDKFVDKSKYDVKAEYIPFNKVTGYIIQRK